MKISLIIIGYNTINTLKKLLDSINRLDYNDFCEVIYVDDGSIDGSYKYFESCTLKFLKKGFVFTKNKGRVFARQKGVDLASGEWLCFLQSNVVVDSSLLKKYRFAITQNNVLAIGGSVDYQSTDLVFEKYLNNKKRGIKQYKRYANIHYQNLLFLNCIIKRSVFNEINFNLEFISYGGKELDFSYRLNLKFPKKTIACPDALVTRINYPNFKSHCLRLHEYGFKNFNLLSLNLKKCVVHYPFLLNKLFVLRFFVFLFYYISIVLYKINIKSISYYMIRLGSLCAILNGYYNSKLFRIPQN